MAEAYKAVLRNCRIAPRKARLVVNLVKGKPVQEALDILKFTNKKAAPILYKIISSAMANATSRATVDVDQLIVSEGYVDPARTFKRFLPRAQGRATPIRKRSSHITIKLLEL